MFPTNYHGKTQDEGSDWTTEPDSESEPEDSNVVQNMPTFECLNFGEYFVPPSQIDDSDAAIEAWQNSTVVNVTVEKDSDRELPYTSDSDELSGGKRTPTVC